MFWCCFVLWYKTGSAYIHVLYKIYKPSYLMHKNMLQTYSQYPNISTHKKYAVLNLHIIHIHVYLTHRDKIRMKICPSELMVVECIPNPLLPHLLSSREKRILKASRIGPKECLCLQTILCGSDIWKILWAVARHLTRPIASGRQVMGYCYKWM